MHLVKFCQYDSKYLTILTNLSKKHRIIQLFLQTNILICLNDTDRESEIIISSKRDKKRNCSIWEKKIFAIFFWKIGEKRKLFDTIWYLIKKMSKINKYFIKKNVSWFVFPDMFLSSSEVTIMGFKGSVREKWKGV